MNINSFIIDKKFIFHIIVNIVTAIVFTIALFILIVFMIGMVHKTTHHIEAKIFKSATGMTIQQAVENLEKHATKKGGGSTGQMSYGLNRNIK